MDSVLFALVASLFFFFFFFSSRRRHTRLQGDWSSDVCSSDLELREPRRLLAQGGSEAEARQFDDVGGEAEVAQRAGLRCDRVCGLAHAREHKRVGSPRRTARPDTDPIATVFDDGVLHKPKMASFRRAYRPERGRKRETPVPCGTGVLWGEEVTGVAAVSVRL